MKFSETIKFLRNKNNLTQGKLGEMLGVGASTVSQWESNWREPSIDNLILIAKKFDVTIDYLLTGDNTKTEMTELKQLQKELLQLQKEYYEQQKSMEKLQKEFYNSVIDIADRGVNTYMIRT